MRNAFFLWVALMSVIAFAMYGIDKQKAKKNKWRITEQTLIVLAWIGGAPGAYFGMKFFHHKTLHTKFRILVPLALFAWCALAVFVILKVQ